MALDVIASVLNDQLSLCGILESTRIFIRIPSCVVMLDNNRIVD